MLVNEEDFQKMLDEEPTDYLTRLVFSDWLHERDDARWLGYKMLGTYKIYPEHCNIDKLDYNCPYYHSLSYCPPKHAFIPNEWLLLVNRYGSEFNCFPLWSIKHDLTRQEVEDTVALAFSKLPENRQSYYLKNGVW